MIRKIGTPYWYISSTKMNEIVVVKSYDDGYGVDDENFRSGNYFTDKEKAKVTLEGIKKIFEKNKELNEK